ncbi:glycosyltransferase [Paraflavisolibacter sp. H34]|uniref:glycosyltransferase n=1 Tax=Huijunlia imazamoxiresistens TaxID=3127457 RepID=UPI00301B496D
MTRFPSLAIVILNWNGKHYLEQFLPSVLLSGYPNLRVIVADNASTDHSVAFLKERFPQVEIISLTRNFGFAKGYNEALQEVSADYYMLLNSDVEVTPGWLEPMVELLESDESYAACQPKIRSYHHKKLFEYAGAGGGWLDAYGYPFARGRVFDVCEEDHGQYDTTTEVFWASGASLLIRSAVFHELKGFDEYFFAHQEEIDLCWRVQLSGRKLFCCPRSVVYHVGGGTLPRGNSRKTYLNFRNNQIMLAKNLPWSEKWWKIPFRILLDDVSALKGLLSGDGGYFFAIVNAHLAFLYWFVFHRTRQKRTLPRRRTSQLQGVYHGNIAWKHFAKKKTKFSEIVAAEESR